MISSEKGVVLFPRYSRLRPGCAFHVIWEWVLLQSRWRFCGEGLSVGAPHPDAGEPQAYREDQHFRRLAEGMCDY